MRSRAEELDKAPSGGFDPVGAVEMTLTPLGAGDFHGSIDEIAHAAAALGADHFYVTNSLGSRITAIAYRRAPRPRRWCRARS
ncbi:hypothetical protein GPX89_24545 [Nocardia sp. ET3-3]|uniref:Uncharacterized protein n=1 Tax=Nocardia terrae TaxID=2675851 RepID=A0A7K1V193_9NOCA|nr:hypothetical protein [Nocardia terrae]MVU80406.1 hypothetical protein [Nocardia terrae]